MIGWALLAVVAWALMAVGAALMIGAGIRLADRRSPEPQAPEDDGTRFCHPRLLDIGA